MNNTDRKSERGIALFMALFALMLLSAIAAGFMFLSSTDTIINANYRGGQTAYFAARAGLQEARVRIMKGPPAGDLYASLPTTLPNSAATTGGLYIVNPSTTDAAIQPWLGTDPYFDDTLCKGNFPNNTAGGYGTEGTRCDKANAPGAAWTPATTNSLYGKPNTASALALKWVRITLKANRSGSPTNASAFPYQVDSTVDAGTAATTDTRPVCWNAFGQQVLLPATFVNCATPPSGSDPMRSVYLLMAMAVTPNGSQRTLSMEVAEDPPTIVHGAVVSNDVIDTVGSSATFIGADNCKCNCSSGTCKDRVTNGACTSGYSAITTSQTVSSSGNPTITPPTTTPATSGTVEHVTPFPYDIPTLINRYKTSVGAVNATGAPYNLACTGSLTATPPTANCGTINTGTFGTAPTNFSTLQADGTPVGNVNQTTYVPGNLDLYAHNSGSGILVVDGDLVVHGGISFYGLIIVKGAVTFTGGGSGGGSNVIGAVLAGQSAQADTLGGSVNLQFDQCALNNDQNPGPPRVLASREIEY